MMKVKVPQSLYDAIVSLKTINPSYYKPGLHSEILIMRGPYGDYEIVPVDEKEYVTVEIREVPVYKDYE